MGSNSVLGDAAKTAMCGTGLRSPLRGPFLVFRRESKAVYRVPVKRGTDNDWWPHHLIPKEFSVLTSSNTLHTATYAHWPEFAVVSSERSM